MDDFKWTTELTQTFLHIRLQNDWLFMEKKQAWKDLYTLVVLNEQFPANITVGHLRKKWVYTIDEYHKAVAQNNKNWIYYDLIHSYLGNSNGMQAYPNWTNEWINRLIDIRTEKDDLFTPPNEFEAWNEVDCCLRAMGLPIECSVRQIEFMWCKLLKIFKSKQRFYKDGITPEHKWPFYAAMNNYLEKHGSTFPSISPMSRRSQLKYSDSDDECLIDLKNSLISAKKEFIQIEIAAIGEISQNYEEFRWTPQWTESFIHIRLQNESLFKRKKQPWKHLHSIMMKNGFPEVITIGHIRKKWTFTLEEYKRAVALNKTNWIYYPLMHSYLGGVDSLDTFKGWSDDWIKNFIQIMIKNNSIFINKKLDEDECWIIIETHLRKNGLPTECSVRNLKSMWSTLKKAFKDNHKYSMKNNTFQITWPFYEDMKQFHEKYDLVSAILPRLKVAEKLKEIDESDDDLLKDNDLNIPEEVDDVKDEVLAVTCRVCLGTSELMFPLFASDGDVPLCDKIMACTSVQITQKDCLPKCVCQNCANELNAAYRFKKKCEETDHVLKTSWQHRQSQGIKKEILAVDPVTGQMEDYRDINADCSMDYYSDNDLRVVIMKKENLDSLKSDIKNNTKKDKLKGLKTKIKQQLPKKKPIRKSNNSIMYPVTTKSGETVYKRKYIYWKVCEICGKSTQRMKEHLKSHSEIKTHKCHLCPKTFTYTASLQTHIKTHDPTPLKICQLCGREFKRNLTYKRHLMYHANERNFSCETCGKAFNTKDILRIHIRSHTGERPYSCKVCGKSFYSNGCVSRHQKVHRKVHHP